ATRPNGDVEMLELETHSTLVHDFVHFALESEAGLKNSFYGQLARGAGYDSMAIAGPETPEGTKTEMVVGILQGPIRDELDPVAFVEKLKAVWKTIGREPPEWLTPDVIAGAVRRFRAVYGRWRATPFGEAMELEFAL